MSIFTNIISLIIHGGKHKCVRCGKLVKDGGWVLWKGKPKWNCWKDYKMADAHYWLSNFPTDENGNIRPEYGKRGKY